MKEQPEKVEELGIIQNVQCGMRDVGQPIMWFTARTLQGDSLQILSWDKAAKLIEDAGVYSINDLNGQGVVLLTDGMLCTYSRFLK